MSDVINFGVAAFITSLGALILAAFNVLATRKRYAVDLIREEEATRKLKAETESIISDAALEMVKEFRAECVQLTAKVEFLEKSLDTQRLVEKGLLNRIRKLEEELENTISSLKETAKSLEIAELNIKFLLEYMQRNGLKIPDLKYRGADGNDGV